MESYIILKEKTSAKLNVQCGHRSVKQANERFSKNEVQTRNSSQCESWFAQCGGTCMREAEGGVRLLFFSFYFSIFSEFLVMIT